MMKDAIGAIAQLVAHLNGIERVSGSNPLSSIFLIPSLYSSTVGRLYASANRSTTTITAAVTATAVATAPTSIIPATAIC